MKACTHPVLVPAPQVVLDLRQPSTLRDDEVEFSFVCLDCGAQCSRGKESPGSLPLALATAA